jgi:hypothetical protein
MQSWLNLMQLEQRPSSVASKPEQRICKSKHAVSSTGAGGHIPCDAGSSGRQSRCAGGERAAGGAAAGHTVVVEGAAGGMGRAEAVRASTHWGRAGDMAAAGAAGAAAGSEDVGPCRVGALGAAEEGAWCSSKLTSSVSELSPSLRDDVQREPRVTVCCWDLRAEAAHRTHSRGAAR